MNLASKVYIAGHRGLAGSAIVRELQRQGYTNLATRTHAELDLEDAVATQQFFEQERPELVFLAAAKVGGIHANNTYPVDFLMSNLLIEANICRAAYATKVKRLIFLGSSCIYPRDCPQPIKEEYLLTGPLEATNRFILEPFGRNTAPAIAAAHGEVANTAKHLPAAKGEEITKIPFIKSRHCERSVAIQLIKRPLCIEASGLPRRFTPRNDVR